MITILGLALFGAIVVGGVVASLRVEGEGLDGAFGAAAAGFVFFALVGIIPAGMMTTNDCLFLPREWVEVDQQRLVAMRNASTTEAVFFLGSGYIGNRHYYHYWLEIEPDGGYQPQQMRATDNVFVYEDQLDSGFLVTLEHAVQGELPWRIRYFGFSTCRPYSRRYEFRIPEGSITQEFDLQ